MGKYNASKGLLVLFFVWNDKGHLQTDLVHLVTLRGRDLAHDVIGNLSNLTVLTARNCKEDSNNIACTACI